MYELGRLLRVCGGFFCSISVINNGAFPFVTVPINIIFTIIIFINVVITYRNDLKHITFAECNVNN